MCTRVADYSPELTAESQAMITVGGAENELGVILSLTPAASKLLGYSRQQAERRHLSLIIPPPVSDFHDSLMRNYMRTGEGTVIESTRLVVMKHRNGNLVPIIMTLRERENLNGPIFVGLMTDFSSSSQQNIIMMDASLNITGATSVSMTMLGIEPRDLEEPPRPSLYNFIANLEELVESR